MSRLAGFIRRFAVPLAGWARQLSPGKLVLSVLAGAAIAVAVAERPLTAPLPSTVSIADMTWVEVRSAIEAGYTRAIVPSGGIEQNGPHMILGKHDHIVAWTAERIARELGHTLVTPVVAYVPEGSYTPPTGHMRFPGTLGVTEDAFAGVLDGIARSLKAGGFKTICFIADHGASMKPQNEVAARLTREWASEGITVISVDDYYTAAGDEQNKYLEAQGETLATIGQHAGITDTSELMAIHPAGVDLTRLPRLLPGLPLRVEPTGVDGDPRLASAQRGQALLNLKVAAAVRQIRLASPTQ
jgi:creatinine amidohydrolase/Fe(II)-dependent formamide hydrolase-like protein